VEEACLLMNSLPYEKVLGLYNRHGAAMVCARIRSVIGQVPNSYRNFLQVVFKPVGSAGELVDMIRAVDVLGYQNLSQEWRDELVVILS
jgi:hypothetical protein